MSRVAYARASDYVRGLAGYNADGTKLSREDASRIIGGVAEALGTTKDALVNCLDDHYRQHETEITAKSAKEFLAAKGM